MARRGSIIRSLDCYRNRRIQWIGSDYYAFNKPLGLVRLQWTTNDHSWHLIGNYCKKHGIVYTWGNYVLMTNCVLTCLEHYHTACSDGLERLGPMSLPGLQLGICSINHCQYSPYSRILRQQVTEVKIYFTE